MTKLKLLLIDLVIATVLGLALAMVLDAVDKGINDIALALAVKIVAAGMEVV